MSRLSDNEILLKSTYHIFLPPKLPQKSPGQEIEQLVNHQLATLTRDVIEQYHKITAYDSKSWIRMSKMLSKLAQSLRTRLEKTVLAQDMRNMKADDVLVLHIKEQNAAVIIRKSSETTTFEIFETQAPNASVMSIAGKLVRYFPGPAIQIPNSTANDPSFIDEIANFLVRMDNDVLEDAIAKTKKAGSKVAEVRDAADPHYISQLFTGILRGLGNEVTPHRVVKRIADEVLWDAAYLPWRRSPIWLIIRVTLQTSVSSTTDYKHFMAYLHARVLGNCCNDSFSSDLLAAMRAKMARRLLKTKDSAPDYLVNEAKSASNQVGALLQARWTAIQDEAPKFGPLSIDPALAVAQSLPNSRNYLKKVLEGRSSRKNPPSLTLDDCVLPDGHLGFSSFAGEALTNSFNKLKHLALFDFEKSVHKYLSSWVDEAENNASACTIIFSCLEQYITAALSYYTQDIADRSIMILTILELWVALDRLVASRYHLLLNYSPEIPDNLIDALLLRSCLYRKQAKMVQNHLRLRHKDASRGSIFSTKIDHNSFSVRFFNQSSSLQALKGTIEQDAALKRARKVEELARLNAEHAQLMKSYSESSCTYNKDQWGQPRHKAKKCQRCKKKRQADNMKIPVHEWPLPSDRHFAEAAVFELQCPEALRLWKDATYRILCDLGDSTREGHASPHCVLGDYDGLRQWADSSKYRITLASSTKSFRQSHYADTKIPSNESMVCVHNGLNLRPFDTIGSTWATGPFIDTSFAKFGTFVLSSNSSYHYLQYALEGTTHTSNQVLSDQSACPKDISLHEHYAFGTLRSGPRLQWMNIVRGLEENLLTFSHEEVYTLHTEAAWQLGVLSSNGRTRNWHVELKNPEFGQLLIHQAFRVLDRVRANWLEGTTVHIIVMLIVRLLSSTVDTIRHGEAYRFLRDARDVTFGWLNQLSTKLQNAELESQVLDYQQRVYEMAIICRSTYDVDPPHLVMLLSRTGDYFPLITCAIIIHDNQPPKSEQAPQRLQELLCRDRRLSFEILPALRHVLGQHPKLLDHSVSRYWNGYRPSDSGWAALPNPNSQWVTTNTTIKSSNSSQMVHFNLLEGTLLVDGQPLGRLPRDYIIHPTYIRLFERKILDVVPSNSPGMVFSMRTHLDGNQVSFCLDATSGELIVQASRDDTTFELIQHSKFADDLPAFFSSDYHHWLNLKNGVMEFRPLNRPWITNKNNWHLQFSDNSASLMQKATASGLILLVDTHSRAFQSISHQIAPLESLRYLHITRSNLDIREFSVELPRMKLAFFLNKEMRLESRNFRGQIVDQTQSSGTMFGLRDQLVLCAKDSIAKSLPRSRTVLIPFGSVKFLYHGNHTQVTIDRGPEREITFYQYRVDTDLGYLSNSDTSLTSRLFKIYLHALTSHCMSDPLTGRTGTEEALYELGEGATTSFEQIDIEQAQILKLIGELTPRRSYYPADLKVMQTTNWASLPPLAQHYAFCTAANAVLERARSLQLFSSLNFDLDPYTTKFEETLLKRAAHRTQIYYPADSVERLSNLLEKERNDDCNYDGKDYKSHGWTNNGQLAAWASGLAHGRWDSSAYTSFNLVSQYEKWNTVYGPSLDLELTFSSDWLDVNLASSWISLYNLCRQTMASNRQYGLCFCLSAATYSGSLSPDLARVLVAFALNKSIRFLAPPVHSMYQLSDRYRPTSSRISELIERACHVIDFTPSNEILKKENESWTDWTQRRANDYKSNITLHKSQLTQFWMDCWPNTPSAPSDTYSSWLNINSCLPLVHAYFDSCQKNVDVQTHLHRIETALRSSPGVLNLTNRTMPSALPHPTPEEPRSLSFVASISFDMLAKRQVHHALLDVPLTPAVYAHSDEGIPPDTTRLRDVLLELRAHSTRPMCRRYGADLELSRIDLSQTNTYISPRQLPPLARLEGNRDLYQTYLRVNKGIIEDWLGPITDLEAIALSSGIWPRLTTRTLLGKLALQARTRVSPQCQAELQKYARTFIEYQRSQRLMSLAMENKYDEFHKELNLASVGSEARENHPDWLLVQIDGNFSARTIQTQVAQEMIAPSSGANTVLQLNMGEGKSSVIVPIIAAALANSTRLVRVVVLKPLWRQMFHLLVNRLSGLVNRRIYYLPFGRHIRVRESQAKQIQAMYEECMREGGILLVQPEHVLSFKLVGIDQLLSSSTREAISASNRLRETQEWLSNNARDILDESDEILHVRYQLVYTVGEQQPLEGHPDRWTTTQQVLSLVASHIRDLKLKYPDKLKYETRSGGQFPFIRIMPESEEVVGRLVHSVARDAISGQISNLNLSILSRATRRVVLRFLTERSLSEGEDQIIHGLGPSTRNGLFLIRGLLACGIIEFALRDKHYRVDYGLHPIRSLLAVPYHAKDIPSLRAEFGHPDVAVVLTCLSYYNSGLTEGQLDTCFDLLYKLDNSADEYNRWVRQNKQTPSSLSQLSGVNLKDHEQFTKELVPAFARNLAVVDFTCYRFDGEFPYAQSRGHDV